MTDFHQVETTPAKLVKFIFCLNVFFLFTDLFSVEQHGVLLTKGFQQHKYSNQKLDIQLDNVFNQLIADSKNGFVSMSVCLTILFLTLNPLQNLTKLCMYINIGYDIILVRFSQLSLQSSTKLCVYIKTVHCICIFHLTGQTNAIII